MIGTKIELAHAVRQDAPEWRDDAGQNLHQALLEVLAPDAWPTETDRLAIERAARAGAYRGMQLLAAQRGWVAVWHPTLVASMAELGLAAACVRDLHHVLHGLVLAGLVEPRATARTLPVLGPAWHYILKAAP